MLLRIDIPPPQSSTVSSTSSSTPRAGNTAPIIPGGSTFHACLTTASNHTNGTLLTVGRKNTDVTFASERSVSRSHCNLRLISLHAAADDDGGDGGNGAVAPSGEDEVEACKSSADGMAVVLEDLNSKFGTFFYTEKEPDNKHRVNRKSNDDSETDETDDEDVGMSGGPVLSQLSSSAMVPEWIQNKIRKRVQNKVILNSLSLPKDITTNTTNKASSSSSSSSLSTTIQCGNAILNVTRITLNICTSQLRSAETKRLRQVSPNIGATITSSINIDGLYTNTTHLVAPTRISTAKSIFAWMYQIPVVSMSFIDALADRTSINDTMPTVEDHIPPGTLPMDALLDLLNDDPTVPQRCLRGYKVLSLEDSDGEMLCRGAGATIIKLYKHETENGQTIDGNFWKVDAWWENLEEEQKKDRLCVVWLTCPKNKQKRGQDFLNKLMKKQQRLGDDDDDDDDADEEQFRISSTNQTKVAKAITSLTLLEDLKGFELRTFISSASSENHHNVNMDMESLSTKKLDEDLHHDDSINVIDNNNDNNNNNNIAVTIPILDAFKEDPTKQETQISSQHPAKSKKLRPSQQSSSAGWMLSSQMEIKGNKSQIGEEEKSVASMEEVTDLIHQGLEHRTTERVSNSLGWKNKLKVAEGGWLVAAPQGRKRARYRRPAAELASNGGGPLSDPAQTEHRKTLIVLQTQLEDVRRHPERNSRTIGRNQNLKDFKRFQKNSVITGARMHSLSQIRLRAVLPKESERQRQLAESEQELEREQRAADCLFAGGEGGTRRGKSTLRNYFGASPAKRGSGRRRRA